MPHRKMGNSKCPCIDEQWDTAARADRLHLPILLRGERPIEQGRGCGLWLPAPALGFRRLLGHELGPGERRPLPFGAFLSVAVRWRLPGTSTTVGPISPYPVRGRPLALCPLPLPPYPRSDRSPALPRIITIRLPLRQHDGIAPFVYNVRHRHPAPAVVPGAVGVLHLRAPVLQRRFLSLVSCEVKIASVEPRLQNCQGCGMIAVKWCLGPLSYESTL